MDGTDYDGERDSYESWALWVRIMRHQVETGRPMTVEEMIATTGGDDER